MWRIQSITKTREWAEFKIDDIFILIVTDHARSDQEIKLRLESLTATNLGIGKHKTNIIWEFRTRTLLIKYCHGSRKVGLRVQTKTTTLNNNQPRWSQTQDKDNTEVQN